MAIRSSLDGEVNCGPGDTADGLLTTLLKTSNHFDLNLICGSRVFKVHKAVVCLRSPVIAAACDGDFKASSNYIFHHSVPLLKMNA